MCDPSLLDSYVPWTVPTTPTVAISRHTESNFGTTTPDPVSHMFRTSPPRPLGLLRPLTSSGHPRFVLSLGPQILEDLEREQGTGVT